MIRASGGSIERKSRLSVSRAISPSAPASSTPGRAAADDARTSSTPARRSGSCFPLRGLEGDEDPAPDLGRVLDRLEARRERRPLVVAEVAVPRPGRDDERVVGDRAAVRQQDLVPLGIEPDGLAEQDRRVAVLPEDRPQRLGDLARARARRSRPGRAAAGTGGGCAGRRASGRPRGRSRGCAPRTGRAKPPPITVTRCGRRGLSAGWGRVLWPWRPRPGSSRPCLRGPSERRVAPRRRAGAGYGRGSRTIHRAGCRSRPRRRRRRRRYARGWQSSSRRCVPMNAIAATRTSRAPASSVPTQRASTTNVPSGSAAAESMASSEPSASAAERRWGSRCASGSSATQPGSVATARSASSWARCADASPTPMPRGSGSQRGRRAALLVAFGSGQSGLRRREPRDRHAERRARDVVEPDLVAERDRRRDRRRARRRCRA